MTDFRPGDVVRLLVAVDRAGDVWAAMEGGVTAARVGSVTRPRGWWDVKTAGGVQVGMRRDDGRPWTPIRSQGVGARKLCEHVYPGTPLAVCNWSAFAKRYELRKP